MDELVQIFIDFIPYDKEFARALIPRYKEEMQLLGGFIRKKSKTLWCKSLENLNEFIDFIDGNGFEIKRDIQTLPWDDYSVEIIPIYPESEEKEEVFKVEKNIQVTITTTSGSLGSLYFPVQDEVLSYTSMEADERPLLECEELFAPRPIRLRIRGCMELLRLVSKSRSGSTSLPRPP